MIILTNTSEMEGKVVENETEKLNNKVEIKGKKKKNRSKVKEDGVEAEENLIGLNFSETLDDQNSAMKNQQGRLTPVPLGINENLQNFLMDDWHMIHLENKLVTLPASETVDHLLEEYSQLPLKRADKGEMIETVLKAFNGYYGSEIMYTPEKWQDTCMTRKLGKNRSSVYGGIHLIRMLARFGWSTNFWEHSCTHSLTEMLEDFLQFLASKASTIFSECNYIQSS